MSVGSPRRVLSTADARILDTVRRFHFLTARQITHRLYRSGSLTYVRAYLKRLNDAGYVQRLYLPRASLGGSSPCVYTLTRKGALSIAGVHRTSRRIRPSEHREHAYLFLAHTLAVNQVLIAAHHLAERVPWIRMADCRHERDLRRDPVRVALKDGRIVTVIPDGFLDFRLHDQIQMCVALELDRGTVEARSFRRKIAALLAFAHGPYTSTFGTSSLTITFVIDADQRRLENTITWAEQELRAQRRDGDADLFRFTRLPRGDVDATELFLAPRWRRPFQRLATPLLPTPPATIPSFRP